MISFSNENEAAIAIKKTNKYKRWKTEEYKNVSKSKNNISREQLQ